MADKDDDVIINEGCPDWMMTMGDAMSLLLCFFVLLLTFSTPNENRLMDVFGGIQGALSLMPPTELSRKKYYYKQDDEASKGKVEKGSSEKSEVNKNDIAPVNLKSMSVVNEYHEFNTRLQRLGFENLITSKQLDQGIQVRIDADEVFYKNRSKVKSSIKPVLESFANLISRLRNEVRITAEFHLYGSIALRREHGNMNPMGLALDRLVKLGNHFCDKYGRNKYNIPRYRFSFASKILTDPGPDYIEFFIYERIPVSEVDMAELIRAENNNSQE